MMTWQPIDSAPDHGDPILIFDPKNELRPVCEARLLDDKTYYDPTYCEWFSDNVPTHWQPLPEPPVIPPTSDAD